MKSKVIDANEAAFQIRYGFSLQACWNELSEHEQKIGCQRVQDLITENCRLESIFLQDDILRIVIGHISKNSIENAKENATSLSRIVLWEPDAALFITECLHEDISELISDPRITIVFGCEDLSMLEQALRDNVYDNNIKHCKIIRHGDYSKADNPEILMFENLFYDIEYDVTKDGTGRKRFGKEPYKNLLYSVRILNNNSLSRQLFDRIPTRDIPVIIVAAGPSLPKNCVELKSVDNRAIIVAVTHAIKSLYKDAVKPHFLACSDALENTSFLSGEVGRVNYNLLCSAYSDRNLQKKYNGNNVYYGFNMCKELIPLRRIFMENDVELDTASVATDIFSLFESAGFTKFILVGQDLAYDDEGNTHAQGERENSIYEKNKAFMKVDGIYGGKVVTRPDWNAFRKYYEKRIKANDKLTVIDATEGGALIHGTIVMPLKQALKEYCIKEYSVWKWIDSLDKGRTDEKEEIEGLFYSFETDCISMRDYLDEALRLNVFIKEMIRDSQCNNDIFTTTSKRYDMLYDVIMNGNRGELLRMYCIADIQRYIEDALTFEGEDRIIQKTIREYDLFMTMRESVDELVEYIREMLHSVSES